MAESLAFDRRAGDRRNAFAHAVAFALLYGACVGLAGIPGALWLHHGINDRLRLALILFAAGAALAGFFAALILSRFAPGRHHAGRFAAAIILLVILSAGFDTAFFYANYITHYVAWWPATFSVHWFFTAIATFAGVGFYYVALGVPMLLPLGLPVLFVAAFLPMARSPDCRARRRLIRPLPTHPSRRKTP